MIDPRNITNYCRSTLELQEFLLFSVVVAGKNSAVQAAKLDSFLRLAVVRYANSHGYLQADFFSILRGLAEQEIRNLLQEVKMGQYNRLTPLIFELAHLCNVNTCTVEDLERFKGLGPKTARFFILHSRKDARIAVLDTHILKHLAKYGVNNVPKSTPQNTKTYALLEKEFLRLVDLSDLTPAEYDLMVWKQYAK